MPPITPLRTLDRTAPTFVEDCDVFFGAEMSVFSVEAEAARLEVVAAEAAAAASAAAAAISEGNAASSEAVATSAANFKGSWAALTGPLNKPASVLHGEAYWNLLNNLADVTTSQPGVSADWAESGVTSVNGQRGVVVIESPVADSLYLNQLYGAF